VRCPVVLGGACSWFAGGGENLDFLVNIG